MRFGCAPANVGYGLSRPFRQALSERGLRRIVGITQFILLTERRPLRRPVAVARSSAHIPNAKSVKAGTMLEKGVARRA